MPATNRWRKVLFGLVTVSILSIAIFFNTWKSIVDIWIRSETFTHGFIIAPISLWLVWSQKNKYRELSPCFSGLGLLFIGINGFLWLLANLINVLVFEQIAVVGILIGSFWALLGNKIAWEMIFPLSFLYFMVPVGEALIAPLMQFTASFTVAMLRLTGIPVYREGTYFTLTSGQWSVVEGCSGLRYLIASVTLGLVYAYITYTHIWKRVIFVILSFLVPVVANGLRAYMIVMIAHLSDMKLATGIDHLIYGGIFFGLVMLILFFIGSFWKDTVQPDSEKQADGNQRQNEPVQNQSQVLVILFLIVTISAVWPLGSHWLKSRQSLGTELRQNFTASQAETWQATDAPDWGWRPKFKGIIAESLDYYRYEGTTAGIYQVSFGNEAQGAELVNSQNYLVKQKDKTWKLPYTGSMELSLPQGSEFKADESVLSSDLRDIVVLRWYVIGNRYTANPYTAKIYQLVKRLLADPSPELQIIMMTEAPHNQYDSAKTLLRKLAETWLRAQQS